MPDVWAAKPHALVAFGGTLGSAGEIWQCGIRVAEAPVISDVELSQISNPLTDPVAYMNWVSGPLKTWFQSATFGGLANSGFSNQCQLTWLKVNNIGTDGKYADKTNTHEVLYSAPGIGSNANAGQCWLITTAVTFRTNQKQRGRASHGRVFLPFSLAATFTPTLSSGQQTAYATGGRDLLRVLNTDGNGVYTHPVRASIQSMVNKTRYPARNPSFSLIDYVTVGSVMDVQRRRKNQLTEIYSAPVAV